MHTETHLLLCARILAAHLFVAYFLCGTSFFLKGVRMHVCVASCIDRSASFLINISMEYHFLEEVGG